MYFLFVPTRLVVAEMLLKSTSEGSFILMIFGNWQNWSCSKVNGHLVSKFSSFKFKKVLLMLRAFWILEAEGIDTYLLNLLIKTGDEVKTCTCDITLQILMISDVFGHVTDVYFKDQKLIFDVIKNQIWWQHSTSLVWEVVQFNSKWVIYICTEGTIWCHFEKNLAP